MYKLPRFIIIFESQSKQDISYLRSIESLGHIIKFVRTDDELLKLSHETLPDLIVLNDTVESVDCEKLVKRLRRDPFLENCSYLLLVDKISHSNTYKAKQLKVELEEFPIHNNHFLQMVKKIINSNTLPRIEFTNDQKFVVAAHVELTEFNSLGFSFICPIKLTADHIVSIDSDFVFKMGHLQGEYYINSVPVKNESNTYLCHTRFKGLSVDVLKYLKNYTGRKLK